MGSMEPHPIPRQITTFEFKLIGFLTIKQFLYIALFGGLGLLVYLIFPIPYINIALGILIALIGIAFAYIKHNERPLDVWVKNLFIRLTAPSQYFYKKNNDAPSFLSNSVPSDPQIINTHIDARDKINKYLHPNGIEPQEKPIPMTHPIVEEVPLPHVSPPPQAPVFEEKQPPQNLEVQPSVAPSVSSTTPPSQSSDTFNQKEIPYLQGTLTTSQGIKLPNIMVYVKDQSNTPIRMLKTNAGGTFVTYRPLEPGSYTIEARDLGNMYFFDRMNVQVVSSASPLHVAMHSKEII